MQVSIHKILFPTDFSAPAIEAQHYALALAEQMGSELHLLHVVVPPVLPFPDATTSWTMPETGVTDLIRHAEQRIADEVASWPEESRVVTSVTSGYAVDEIVNYAKAHDIDLIVAGTHGLSGLSHLLMGSVAEKLVRVAPCPVLTVRPGGHQFISDAHEVATSSGAT
ncbi:MULTISPECIES: universal stress protein [unclassified Schlesneria]|uniref:universal stress protein n=1 Tax=unclassified Schlesneria TaxID=2762017 RepID=UPI002F1DCD97